MPHLSDIKVKHIAAGLEGKYVHGATTTMGWVTVKAGSDFAAHHHPHEQITVMIEGELEMKIGDETIKMLPGEIRVIPANTIHSAYAVTDAVLIDFFSPVREDYR